MESKCKNTKENTLNKNSGRPNLLSDELFQKTKDIIGTRNAGTVISRRLVIAIGTGLSLIFRIYLNFY